MTNGHLNMREIWLEVETGEKEFLLYIHKTTGRRMLKIKGEIYTFKDIYSYRNYARKTIRLKLVDARKVE